MALAIENLFPFTSKKYAPISSEIAIEISSLNHPNTRTAIDFSHAYINCKHNKVNYIDQLSIIIPLAKHLHIHDSFGKLKAINTHIHS